MNEPVSILINVHNEAGSIEQDIRAIQQVIVAKLDDAEFLIAEDGSRDGTSEIVARLADEIGARHLTSLDRKGYARAFRDGVGEAACPWVFFADTGGKFEFEDFWKLYEARHDADLVIGRRSPRTDQFYRRLLTVGFNWLLRRYFGGEFTDADCGFRLYRAAFLKAVAAQEWTGKDLISAEIMLRVQAMGGRIREVPIAYHQRQGVSRGLPLERIPDTIWRVVNNLARLKRACDQLARDRNVP